MDEAEKNFGNSGSEDVIDGVMASCLKKNEEDEEMMSEYQNRFRKEVGIPKTDKHDVYYSMDYPCKGYLMIFAHSKFTFGGLKERYAELDAIALTKTFTKFGFEINIYLDKTLEEIEYIMREVSSKNFEDYACLVVAISTHGKKNLLCANDTVYDPEVVFYEPIKNIGELFGKPKIFFLGACRGLAVDQGISLLRPAQTDGGALEEYRIPREADFLFVYATVYGYISYSNNVDGSQFFKYLTQTFDDYPDLEINHIMVFANNRLSIDFLSKSPNKPLYNGNKQCMSFNTTLTRLLKFEQKNHEQILSRENLEVEPSI